MSNPSTIWATLSVPNPPIGSVPFVLTDSASIVTDVGNFLYKQSGDSLVGSQQNYQLSVTGGVRVAYQDTTLTPLAAITINKPAGRIKMPFSAGLVPTVVSSSYCFANSIVLITNETVGQAASLTVTPANGSFTITNNNAVPNQGIVVSFVIINVTASNAQGV